MTRRLMSATLATLLALAPFPAWSQVGRVSIEISASPAPAISGALNAASLSLPAAAMPAASPALALTPAPAPAPVLALAAFVLAAPAIVAPAAPARLRPAIVRAKSAAAPATPVQLLSQAAERAAALPERIGRLYDSAPDVPDFAELSPVKAITAPAAWRPGTALLKPAAAVANAWRLARHERRLKSLAPGERVTTEELGMREALSEAHAAIATSRLQDGLQLLKSLFQDRAAAAWYRANSAYSRYQTQGHAYIRFIEGAVKRAYERAHARSRDAALVDEARAAARAGTLLGHEWRRTTIQELDSAHCAHHALYNAITASAGFAYPVTVARFIERARQTLNERPAPVTQQVATLSRQLGLKHGVDVGEGMDTGTIARWAALMGAGVEARGPPSIQDWSGLLGGGREVLIGLRMFHERYKLTPEQAAASGQDYQELHHEVYLLGAFDSPSLGTRLYMVQDSGSGATDFYTAEELSAVSTDVLLITAASPVTLP